MLEEYEYPKVCPACKKSIVWIKSEIGCEDCGSHPAIQCPECDVAFDLIFANGDMWLGDDGVYHKVEG
jgi:hypothetical protein